MDLKKAQKYKIKRGVIWMAANKRFEVTQSQGTLDVIRVIKDTETGVQYLQTISGGGVGITLLVDAEGKPLLDK
jgi:hypothetical protein